MPQMNEAARVLYGFIECTVHISNVNPGSTCALRRVELYILLSPRRCVIVSGRRDEAIAVCGLQKCRSTVYPPFH